MAKLERRTPLGEIQNTRFYQCDSYHLIEETDLGFLKIVSRALTEKDIRSLEGALNIKCPRRTNGYEISDDLEIACLAPGEWLIVCQYQQLRNLENQMKELLVGKTVLICDLTDGRCPIKVIGSGASEVLSSLVPIDFGSIPNRGAWCATTLFSEIAVFLSKSAAPASFRVVVDQAYADYAWRMLEGASDGLDV